MPQDANAIAHEVASAPTSNYILFLTQADVDRIVGGIVITQIVNPVTRSLIEVTVIQDKPTVTVEYFDPVGVQKVKQTKPLVIPDLFSLPS